MQGPSISYEPEQLARQQIDKLLFAAGWVVQNKAAINLNAAPGVAIREYLTDVGEADYILFVDKIPVGVIEAKREEEGVRLTVHELQSHDYATAKLKWVKDSKPLPFVYESTGTVTRFTDYRDPKPRSRTVFAFHKPETLRDWYHQQQTFRERLQQFPELPVTNLRDCQFTAITNLEQSFGQAKPRALVQMATGAGKTFTAITSIYRLLKHAKARRVLFLVDTKNLGEQAEKEFMDYTPVDDKRKFTELYAVQRLRSSAIDKDSHVCISTIQRMYSILKGEDIDEHAEEISLFEITEQQAPKEVSYNPSIPIEFFDVIIIDECHRSIYNLWKQVLDYFDAFLVGLTATPDKRTFGFFHENVVSEYSHEKAVADGVNVGYEVFTIETTITKQGATIAMKEQVEKRERLSRRKRWEQLDEDLTYTGKQLDREVVNPSTILNIIRAFKENITTEIFPGRKEVPKTLIFAKTDSHADDIIEIVRREFGESNDFCRKITYQEKDPKSILTAFRNDYNPRIAVTVDMIATGTDVKAIECLIFMRDVRSKNYFEQMKGRGTRTLSKDELQKRTTSAQSAKTHFVIVDAVGVTKTIKTDSRPMERKPAVSLKDLLHYVMMGSKDEDTLLSVGNRLARLEKDMSHAEKEKFKELAGGKTISQVVHHCWDAFDPDVTEQKAGELFPGAREQQQGFTDEQLATAQNQMADAAANVLHGELIDYIVKVRQTHDQIIDNTNLDTVELAAWDGQAKDNAEKLVTDLADYLQAHKDEITALSIFYSQPYSRRVVTYRMIKDLLDRLRADRPVLAPIRLWQAYERLDNVVHTSPLNELTALVALVRRAVGKDEKLTPLEQTVNLRFRDWVFGKQVGPVKYTDEQMDWLRMIRNYIAESISIETNDIENLSPFVDKGGLMKFYNLFGDSYEELLHEMNSSLTA